MNAPFICETPVALVMFNRPELTRRVFRRIAEARPTQLLLIADGPRKSRPGDATLCEQTRLAVTAVDWPCVVQTNYSQENMGCRNRMVSGLDWVFQQVEEAIILEDDVLPELSFFRFCEELLQRYRDDARISMMSGFSIVEDQFRKDESYYFSRLSHIWGWATWRRSWQRYDEHLEQWPAIRAAGLMREIFPNPTHRAYWTEVFDAMHGGTGPNTWDIQWFYTNIMNSALSIIPRANLIENLGFGPEATHTIHATDQPKMKTTAMLFPLCHPAAVVPLRSMDLLDQDRSGCARPTLPRRVRNKLRRMTQRRSL